MGSYIYNSLWSHYPKEMLQLGFAVSSLHLGYRYFTRREPWAAHLEESRAATKCWIEHARANDRNGQLRAIVLGSGWLQDIAIDALKKGDSICLVDANPLVTFQSWSMLRGKDLDYSAMQSDVSSRLSAWISALRQRSAMIENIKHHDERWSKVISMLRAIPNDIPASIDFDWRAKSSIAQSPNLIISLNLLSQLPLPWQGHIEHTMSKLFSPKLVAEREIEWRGAFAEGASLLIADHIKQLAALAMPNGPGTEPTLVGMICDLAIVEYQLSHPSSSPNGDIPVQWDRSQQLITSNEVSSCETVFELCDTVISQISGLNLDKSWLWRLQTADQSVTKKYGISHLVGAFSSSKFGETSQRPGK